eukprot:767446-Hanusia_phi.AAC.3
MYHVRGCLVFRATVHSVSQVYQRSPLNVREGTGGGTGAAVAPSPSALTRLGTARWRQSTSSSLTPGACARRGVGEGSRCCTIMKARSILPAGAGNSGTMIRLCLIRDEADGAASYRTPDSSTQCGLSRFRRRAEGVQRDVVNLLQAVE